MVVVVLLLWVCDLRVKGKVVVGLFVLLISLLLIVVVIGGMHVGDWYRLVVCVWRWVR